MPGRTVTSSRVAIGFGEPPGFGRDADANGAGRPRAERVDDAVGEGVGAARVVAGLVGDRVRADRGDRALLRVRV